MPTRIPIFHRIIQHPGVPVPRGGVACAGDEAVGTRESAQRGVVESCHVEHEAEVVRVRALTCVGAVGWERAAAVAFFAKGFVEHDGEGVAGGVNGFVGEAGRLAGQG